MVEKHNHADFRVVMVVSLGVLNQRIKTAQARCQVVKTRTGNELAVKTEDSWSLVIVSSKFEVNNLVLFNSKVTANSSEEGVEGFLFNIKHVRVLFIERRLGLEELINRFGCKDWLQVALFVMFEFFRAVQMNAKVRNVHHSVLGVPQLLFECSSFLIF